MEKEIPHSEFRIDIERYEDEREKYPNRIDFSKSVMQEMYRSQESLFFYVIDESRKEPTVYSWAYGLGAVSAYLVLQEEFLSQTIEENEIEVLRKTIADFSEDEENPSTTSESMIKKMKEKVSERIPDFIPWAELTSIGVKKFPGSDELSHEEEMLARRVYQSGGLAVALAGCIKLESEIDKLNKKWDL